MKSLIPARVIRFLLPVTNSGKIWGLFMAFIHFSGSDTLRSQDY